MPYPVRKPLIPPKPKTPEQEQAAREHAELVRAWNAPYKPPGKLVFDVPKRPPEEMTRAQLKAAWDNTSMHRDRNAE